MALTELKGQQTGTQKVVIERGPVRVFSEAILDPDPVYDGERAPVPPTFPFVMPYWGSLGSGGAAGLPIDRLRGPGRAILHGEQAFEYHRPLVVGDVLVGEGKVAEAYEKESGDSVMTFVITETQFRDEKTGELVLTSRTNLLHRGKK
jgi:hypothetical protein